MSASFTLMFTITGWGVHLKDTLSICLFAYVFVDLYRFAFHTVRCSSSTDAAILVSWGLSRPVLSEAPT